MNARESAYIESEINADICYSMDRKNSGGIVSFIVKGGRDRAAVVADNVRVATLTVSLGTPETLIEHPASMTHSTYTEDELEAAGIPAGLIRLSVGLEDPDDLIADLDQAFSRLMEKEEGSKL